MKQELSPKYRISLILKIQEAIKSDYSESKKIEAYIESWCNTAIGKQNEFRKKYNGDRFLRGMDLFKTLSSIKSDELLLKIAIDLNIETSVLLPSIPVFKNIIIDYKNAHEVFSRSIKLVEEKPDESIGLANSALESIIKEILSNTTMKVKYKERDTLYKQAENIIKAFKMYPNSDLSDEIRNLGSGLLKACQAIEQLRSTKTFFHGKTSEDIIITDSLYAYFIVNAVATVGLFLESYHKLISSN